MRAILLAFIISPVLSFDCCTGHVCNDDWDVYDSSTGNCCMIPSGGKMIENTAAGSCSCPAAQECDLGPRRPQPHQYKPPLAPAPAPQPQVEPPLTDYRPSYHSYHPPRSHKEIPLPTLFELGAIVVGSFLFCCLGLCTFMGYRRLSYQYDELRRHLERTPINQRGVYPPYAAQGGDPYTYQGSPGLNSGGGPLSAQYARDVYMVAEMLNERKQKRVYSGASTERSLAERSAGERK